LSGSLRGFTEKQEKTREDEYKQDNNPNPNPNPNPQPPQKRKKKNQTKNGRACDIHGVTGDAGKRASF